MKKYLTLLLTSLVCMCVLFSAVVFSSAETAPVPMKGLGTESSPYVVENPGNLIYLSQEINSGVSFRGKIIVQTADISLSDSGFKPAGTEGKPFCGTYDGAGFVISGLNIVTAGDYNGLFGYVLLAELRNITVEESIVSGGAYSALIAGVAEKSSAVNCTGSGSVTSTRHDAGGLFGYLINSTARGCVSYGSVTGVNFTGGIASAAGASNILSCVNNSTVTGGTHTGGITGDADNTSSVRYCANLGDVHGGEKTGGIAGIAVNNRYLTDCKNSGTVSGTLYTGGIAGYCDNADIASCININLTSGENYAGGIAGYAVKSQIADCCNFAAVQANGTAAGGVGYADSDSVIMNVRFASSGLPAGKAGGESESALMAYVVNNTAFGKFVSDTDIIRNPYNVWIISPSGKILLRAEHTSHSGGQATCSAGAVCEICSAVYTEKNTAVHSGGEEIRNYAEAGVGTDGYSGDRYCAGCGQLISAGDVIPGENANNGGFFAAISQFFMKIAEFFRNLFG